ncbi:uncharacterized protein LOC101864144 [Aplysia californica]|uniref:Uncharacterized protein LOC101864144 n=1 Tax=Aplysia californica TaxID=6500 RepID=A0ABM0JPI3_APLCA|nr:uncharacterized protein LOC101864144 [Aplysia californica]
MRLFLPQSVTSEEAVTPPFLSDREEDTRLALLRDSTMHVKEGNQRLPTPEKKAIMELSSSFEKRRLGKQQQILSEMTQRCREQEVTDLSSKITAKCDLKTHGRGLHLNTARDNTFYSTTSTFKGSKHRLSDVQLEALDTGTLSPDGSRKVNAEKTYKFFPARHIMRQQTKTNFLTGSQAAKIATVNVPRNLRRSTEYYLDSHRSPRYNSLAHGLDAGDSSRRFPPPIHQHPAQVIAAKPETLAPLVLPRLGMVSMAYQDRIDSYISSSRLATVPRTKTILDTSSVSGRSYNSLLNFNSSKREATLHGHDKGDHSLVNIKQMPDDDLTSMGSVVGRGFGNSADNLIGCHNDQ